MVADSRFAALELLHAVAACLTVVTRLRLDAALSEPAQPRQPNQVGRPQLQGKRLPTLAQVATNPAQALGWFVQRWQVEVTCAETRAHLEVVETQRQWSNLAIAAPHQPSWP